MRRPTRHMIERYRSLHVLLIVAIIGVWLWSPGGLAASPQSLQAPTLPEVVRLAIAKSGRVVAEQEGLVQAGLKDAETKASFGWGADVVAGGESRGADNPTADFNSLHARVSIHKTLSPSPLRTIGLKKTAAEIDAAKSELQATVAKTILSAFDGYRNLELALLQCSLAQKATAHAKDEMRVARRQTELDALSPVDKAKAEIGYKQAENEERASCRVVDIARSALADLLDVDPTALNEEELPLPTLEGVVDQVRAHSAAYWPPSSTDLTLEALESQATSKRTEVVQAKAALTKSHAAVDSLQIADKPVVSVQASYSWSADRQVAVSLDNRWVFATNLTATDKYQGAFESRIPSTQEPAWQVGFNVNLNVWDSYKRQIQMREARSAVKQANSGVDGAKSAVSLEVNQQFNDVQGAWEALILSDEKLLLTWDELETERRRASLGLSTELQVEGYRLKLYQSALAVLKARYGYETSLVDLGRSAGMSADEMLHLVDQVAMTWAAGPVD